MLEFDLGHAAIELFERLLDLCAPPRVRGGRELPFELGAGKPQRLERTYLLGIADVAPLRLRAFALELLHPFLNSRVCVDQAFAGITHSHPHQTSPSGTDKHHIVTAFRAPVAGIV